MFPIHKFIWMLLLVTFYNFVAFLKKLVPDSWLPHKDVSKEVVLITGGGMGIGRLMSLSFAKLGSTVVIWDINQKSAEGIVQEIKEAGGKAHSYVVDCCDRQAIYRAADKVKAEVGDVTILINNAGIVTGKKFLECPDHLITRTMDLNINAHFWTLKAFLPKMIENNHGHIVTIASLAGMIGTSGLVDYSASKYAAVGLDESLYFELQMTNKQGVKCTVVCPFFINTGMFDGVKTKHPGFLDVLEPEYVVEKIMTAVRTNQRVLILPERLAFAPAIKHMWNPKAFLAFTQFGDSQRLMDTFVGRNKQD